MRHLNRKPTFRSLFALLILFCAGDAFAQFVGGSVTVAHLPACNGPNQVALVTDATNATTLGAGGGTASVWVTCASGSWAIDAVAAVSDLSGYAELSPATSLAFTPGTTAAVTTTNGSITLTAAGAGKDVALVAADDVLLTPTDALTAVVGGAVAVTTTAGAIGLTAGGTTQDITLTSVDDVILVPADALTATVGGAVAVTTTAGAITLTAGGTTEDISVISVDQVIVDGAGGADELVIDDDEVLVGSAAAFRLAIASAPPVACASGTKASMYYDSDINKVCICNGTNYVLANDDSTTTGCS